MTYLTQDNKPQPKILGASLVAAGLVIADLILTQSLWAVGVTAIAAVGAILYLLPETTFQKLYRLDRKFKFVKIAVVTFGIVVGLHYAAEPASAYFFKTAEDGLVTAINTALGSSTLSANGASVENLVRLTFNVLRGMFLLYLGISIVKVFNAMREDEDWKTLARQPLIFIVGITLGDVISGMIIGTA